MPGLPVELRTCYENAATQVSGTSGSSHRLCAQSTLPREHLRSQTTLDMASYKPCKIKLQRSCSRIDTGRSIGGRRVTIQRRLFFKRQQTHWAELFRAIEEMRRVASATDRCSQHRCHLQAPHDIENRSCHRLQPEFGSTVIAGFEATVLAIGVGTSPILSWAKQNRVITPLIKSTCNVATSTLPSNPPTHLTIEERGHHESFAHILRIILSIGNDNTV